VEISGSPNLTAPAVILAVPPDRLIRLVPRASGLDTEALGRLGSSPIINLHVLFDRQVTDLPFAAGVRTPVQWFFDRTQSSGLREGQYLAISLSAADAELNMTADELRQRYVEALGELLPESRRAYVKNFFVTRERSGRAPGRT
jgi:protoporphyrinogen oxidase